MDPKCLSLFTVKSTAEHKMSIKEQFQKIPSRAVQKIDNNLDLFIVIPIHTELIGSSDITL